MELLAMAHSLGILTGPLGAGILLDFFSFTAMSIFATLVLASATLILASLQRTAAERTKIRS